MILTDDRREQLMRKSGKRIAALFRAVMKAPATLSQTAPIIDVMMFWPPDHSGEIDFLFGSGKDNPDWNLRMPASHWRLAADAKGKIPAGLLADLRHLFRRVWKDISSESPAIEAYLRLHDDVHSVNLRNGRRTLDTNRADYREPSRKAFRKPRSLKVNRRGNGDRVQRGDSLAKVKKTFGVKEDPQPEKSVHRDAQYHWPELGIRIWFRKRRVESVYYNAPFAHKISGVWIGAHAWQVDQILGRASKEDSWRDYSGRVKDPFRNTLRIWEYTTDVYLWLRFDDKDRVETIGR
jgi:hypothetical protein